jgi:putative CRISPR-associated protein (TIGR02619 family)
MMNERRLPVCMVATCGTSVLTNQLPKEEPELFGLLRRHANAADAAEVPQEDRAKIEAWVARRRAELEQAGEEQARSVSAELSSMLAYGVPQAGFLYYILTSDTWLGRQTGELVAGFLAARFGVQAQMQPVKDLQTADQAGFSAAVVELVRFVTEQIRPLSGAYHIVFNPTGGFKAVSGVMQTLAMLVADETIYIFEGTKNLLRLPRLPVKLDTEGVVRAHLAAFRLMGECGEALGAAEVAGIPSVFLMEVDGEHVLSAWGELVWRSHRDGLYDEQLWPSPSERVVFGAGFEKAADDDNVRRYMREVNRRVDQLVRYMASGGKYNPPSLDVHLVQGEPAKRHKWMCDAWAARGAWRIYFNVEGEAAVLGMIGEGLGH